MKKYKASIDSLYHGSAVDGKGLRCVVFFNGCNLRCGFCHNPETLYVPGKEMELEELVARLLRYKPYIRKGGVTLSGGEPFLQAEFCKALMARLKEEELGVCIETNGYITDPEMIALAESILLDVKNQDQPIAPQLAGFLQTCTQVGTPVCLTNVLVPGCNDDAEHLRALYRLRQSSPCVQALKFLPFRKLCVHKYEELGREYPYEQFAEASAEDIWQAKALLEQIARQGEQI